jgi:hypothetical protein
MTRTAEIYTTANKRFLSAAISPDEGWVLKDFGVAWACGLVFCRIVFLALLEVRWTFRKRLGSHGANHGSI